MEQYQINGRFQMRSNILSGALYKMHVVAHTFLFCRTRRAGDHFSRKIAKRDVMTAFRHFYGRLPFTASGIQMLTGSGWLLVTAVLTGELSRFDPAAITARSVIAWSYLVVFGSLIGFSTFTWLMKHSTPAKVSTYAYVNPVVAVFLGWLVLHEPVSSRIFIAAAVIIAGVAIITVTKNRRTLTILPRQAVAAAAAAPGHEQT